MLCCTVVSVKSDLRWDEVEDVGSLIDFYLVSKDQHVRREAKVHVRSYSVGTRDLV